MQTKPNKGLKFIFEFCEISLDKSLQKYHFHNSFRFEFLNCKFMSDEKLINDLNKVQTKLYNKMYCCKLSDFTICVNDINKNQQFEASAKPELDPHTNDSKEIHANKTTEQSYKLNDICLFDLP